MKKDRFNEVWRMLGLFLLALVAYLPSLRFGFVWDDLVNIQTELIRFNHIHQTFFPSTMLSLDSAYYRPWGWFVWYLVRGFADEAPLSYHVLQVFVHGAVTLWVFVVSRQLLGLTRLKQKWIPFWTAALFAIHPVHVEVVSYVSAFYDLWLTLFVLMGIFFWVRGRTQGGVANIIFSCGCFLGALLTKETAIIFPLLLLALELLLKGQKKYSIDLKAYLGLVGVLVLYFFMHSIGSSATVPLSTSKLFSSIAFFRAFLAYGYYIMQIFIPWNFNYYPVSVPYGFFPCLMGLMAVFVTLFGLGFLRRNPLIFFLSTLIFLSISPALIIAMTGLSKVYLGSRYVYLASFASCFLVALGGSHLSQSISWQKIVLAVGVIVLIGGEFVSWKRSQVWANEQSFWSNAARQNPQAMAPYVVLGRIQFQEGKVDEAMAIYAEGLKKTPESHQAFALLLNLVGAGWMSLHQPDQAESYFIRSVEAESQVENLTNLGLFYFEKSGANVGEEREKFLKKAFDYLQRSQKLDPLEPKNYYYLGHVFINLGEREKGIDFLKQTMSAAPKSSWARQAQMELEKMVP